jgi:dihydroorotate dehydrogenase
MPVDNNNRLHPALYPLLRHLLFLIDAEQAHRIVLLLLRAVHAIPGVGALMRAVFRVNHPALATEVMGLRFPNPVGLAAGLDKNGECYGALMDLGFGSVEIGTVTPLPQPGNPKRRIFRLPAQHAVINRMGFPSDGLEGVLPRLTCGTRRGILGVNIGKNKQTPNERAVDDYLEVLRAVYACADYVTINVSSPNTPQLRELQNRTNLGALLAALKSEQIMLGKTRRVYVPIALKVSPDLGIDELNTVAELVREHRIDAVVATNTTIERTGVEHELLATETGGLSGQPLKQRSTEVIRQLYNQLRGEIPIIGVGGIETADDAWEKLVAGADLVQVYTGFIYRGPMIARTICKGLSRRTAAAGCDTLREAVEKARSGVHLMR